MSWPANFVAPYQNGNTSRHPFPLLAPPLTAVERIKEYSEVPSEAPPIVEGKRPPAHWPQAGNIHVKVFPCLV